VSGTRPSIFVRGMAAGALVVALATGSGLLRGLRVDGVHMLPTLSVDDRVLVHRSFFELPRGAVVAYRSPLGNPELKLGRVIGVAGDRVEMDRRGLMIDGIALGGSEAEACLDELCLIGSEALGDHHYLTRRADRLEFLHFDARTVPAGYVFVLNDNRIDERDSRIYGAIPLQAVVGVASFVYFARDETGIRWDRMRRRVS
jgi:signal peptidase I